MPKCISNVDMTEYSDLDKVAGKVGIQKGGDIGYHLRVGEPTVGGQPVVKGYSIQPELKDGTFIDSNLDALCDPTEMTGGRRNYKKRKSHRRKRNKINSKKRKSVRRKTNRNVKRKSIRRKSIRKRKSIKRRKMRGGQAPYEASFQNPENVYSPDMLTREFGCKQPTWEPKCA